MPNYLSSFLSIIALSLILSSCKDDPEPNVQLPSNLVVAAEVDKEERRLSLCNRLRHFGEFLHIHFSKKTERKHMLKMLKEKLALGIKPAAPFPITVRANTTHNDYIEDLTEISVTVDNVIPGNGGNPPASGYTHATHIRWLCIGLER